MEAFMKSTIMFTCMHLILAQELLFWGMDESEIEPCCWAIYSKNTEHRQTLAELDENFAYDTQEAWAEEGGEISKWRMQLWAFLEEPRSSRWAKVSENFTR